MTVAPMVQSLLLQAMIGKVPLSPEEQKQVVEYSMYVDIRELVKYEPDGNRVLGAIVKQIESDPDGFVNEKIKRVTLTSGQKARALKPLQLYGVERVLPRDYDESTKLFTEHLRAFYQNESGKWLYRMIDAKVEKREGQSSNGPDAAIPTTDFKFVSSQSMPGHEPIDAANVRFKVVVGIEERTLILEDENYGIRKMYPVAVGNKNGDPNGRSRSEYLIGKDNYVGINTYEYMRTDYDYGAMALRIQINGGHSAILMHGPVNPQLQRAWVSKACLRMQPKDVNEAFMAIKASGHKAQLIAMKELVGIDAKYDHPYPRSNKSVWDTSGH